VFLGRDLTQSRNYSEKVAAEIDEEVYRLLSEGYQATEEKLKLHMDKLVKVAEQLIEKEKLNGEEFKKIMEDAVEPSNENGEAAAE
jgi:cell division protease FtsH